LHLAQGLDSATSTSQGSASPGALARRRGTFVTRA